MSCCESIARSVTVRVVVLLSPAPGSEPNHRAHVTTPPQIFTTNTRVSDAAWIESSPIETSPRASPATTTHSVFGSTAMALPSCVAPTAPLGSVKRCAQRASPAHCWTGTSPPELDELDPELDADVDVEVDVPEASVTCG